jgi:hypothetical protein
MGDRPSDLINFISVINGFFPFIDVIHDYHARQIVVLWVSSMMYDKFHLYNSGTHTVSPVSREVAILMVVVPDKFHF